MAQFTDFPESNKALGPPADMTRAECGTLRVYTDGTTCISCWQPTAEELAELNAGGSIWLGVRSGATQPAVWVSGFKPEMAPVLPALTPAIEDALQQFARRLPLAAHANSKGPKTGAEILATDPDVRQPNGAALEPETLYLIASEESQAQHLELMRQAYRQGGGSAVAAYLRPYVHFLHTPETWPAQ